MTADYDVHAELARLNACRPAREWIAGKDEVAMWRDCERGDWLLWWAAKCGVNRRVLVLAVCDCARLALPIFEAAIPEDDRPRDAIGTAESWAHDEASISDVRAAASAAFAAADGAVAAVLAAFAAGRAARAADGSVGDAAAYAVAAAYAAAEATAAYAASESESDAARATTLRACADFVRARIPTMPRPNQ